MWRGCLQEGLSSGCATLIVLKHPRPTPRHGTVPRSLVKGTLGLLQDQPPKTLAPHWRVLNEGSVAVIDSSGSQLGTVHPGDAGHHLEAFELSQPRRE